MNFQYGPLSPDINSRGACVWKRAFILLHIYVLLDLVTYNGSYVGQYLITWAITHIDRYVHLIHEWDKINCLYFPGALVHLMMEGLELCYLMLFDDSLVTHTPSALYSKFTGLFFFLLWLSREMLQLYYAEMLSMHYVFLGDSHGLGQLNAHCW